MKKKKTTMQETETQQGQVYSRPALKNILFHSSAATLTGALGGATLATIKGANRFSWGFMMSFNWCVISLPFFSIRESILYIRHRSNQANGIPAWASRNKDASIASTVSGMIVGGGLEHYCRGRWAVLPGILFYGSIAAGGQFLLNMGHHYRFECFLTN
jgi:hypothetical protein